MKKTIVYIHNSPDFIKSPESNMKYQGPIHWGRKCTPELLPIWRNTLFEFLGFRKSSTFPARSKISDIFKNLKKLNKPRVSLLQIRSLLLIKISWLFFPQVMTPEWGGDRINNKDLGSSSGQHYILSCFRTDDLFFSIMHYYTERLVARFLSFKMLPSVNAFCGEYMRQ